MFSISSFISISCLFIFSLPTSFLTILFLFFSSIPTWWDVPSVRLPFAGSTHKKIFQESYLMGCTGKSRWVQKAILTSPIWFQDRRRQSLALYSVWNGEAGLLHIKTSWRTSLGLQYVSNLLRRILHAAQVTNIASDLVKIATQERFLFLLDDQKPGVCNLVGIDSNGRCRGWWRSDVFGGWKVVLGLMSD